MLQVYANDLNPKSFHYLQENIKLNKVNSAHLPLCAESQPSLDGQLRFTNTAHVTHATAFLLVSKQRLSTQSSHMQKLRQQTG